MSRWYGASALNPDGIAPNIGSKERLERLEGALTKS